jgi:hypothetical protein
MSTFVNFHQFYLTWLSGSYRWQILICSHSIVASQITAQPFSVMDVVSQQGQCWGRNKKTGIDPLALSYLSIVLQFCRLEDDK